MLVILSPCALEGIEDVSVDVVVDRVGRREGNIPDCSAKLDDPGKPAFRKLCILPQRLRTFPFVPFIYRHHFQLRS